MDRREFLLASLGTVAASVFWPVLAGPLHPGRLLTPRGAYVGDAAAASWPFTSSLSLAGSPGPTLGFTRPGHASLINSSGTLICAAENIVENSIAIGQGGWTVQSNVTVTPDDIADPDGGANGNKLEDLQSTNGAVLQVTGSIGSSGQLCQVSIYIKRVSTSGTLRIRNPGATANGDWDLDLSALSNDWELITAGHAAVTVQTAFTAQGSSDGLQLDTESGVVTVHAYAGQFNRGTFLHPHVLNSATSGAKYDGPQFDHDITSLESLGLIMEEERENEALYPSRMNNAAWVKTSITGARDAVGLNGGAGEGSSVTATGANGTIFQTVTKVSAENTYSTYVKRKTGTGTIEITDNGGSNYTDITALINSSTYTRFSLTRTQANPEFGFRIVTNGDAIEVDGNQLEAGAMATTYAFNTAAPTTRPAGVSSTDISSINLTGGFTWKLYGVTSGAVSGTQILGQIDDGTANDRVYMVRDSSGNLRVIVLDGGVEQANLDFGVIGDDTDVSVVARIAANDFSASLNGGTPVTDTSGTLPTGLANMRAGHDHTPANYWNSHIKEITIWV